MSQTPNKPTLRISVLLICAIFIPLVGRQGAKIIEQIGSSPKYAALFWSICLLVALTSIAKAHSDARSSFNFSGLYPLKVLIGTAAFGTIGWIGNNAYYNYFTFSDFSSTKFKVEQSDDEPNHFLFKGHIETGAGSLVIRTMLGAPKVNWSEPVFLELHSEGGRPQEAILIAEFVQHYGINIEVRGKCISACTLILLSSEFRLVDPRAWIGFHAAYAEHPDGGQNYNLASLRFYDERLEALLISAGADTDFIKKTKVRDARGGYFPTFEELQKSGVVNRQYGLNGASQMPPSYL